MVIDNIHNVDNNMVRDQKPTYSKNINSLRHYNNTDNFHELFIMANSLKNVQFTDLNLKEFLNYFLFFIYYILFFVILNNYYNMKMSYELYGTCA